MPGSYLKGWGMCCRVSAGKGSETHSALAQTNLRKKPAGAGDTLLGDERTISAQKGRDTQEEL